MRRSIMRRQATSSFDPAPSIAAPAEPTSPLAQPGRPPAFSLRAIPLHGPPIAAPALQLAHPAHPTEHEADHIAQQITRGHANPVPPVQRAPTTGHAVDPAVAQQVDALHGGGRPLPTGDRRFFEERMGTDLGHVRIHMGNHATRAARQLGARAFTVGADIAFDQGEYAPGTSAGRDLLAHELTHVAQQGGHGRGAATIQAKLRIDEQNITDPQQVPVPNNVTPALFSQALRKLIESWRNINVTHEQLANLGALLMGEDVYVHTNTLNMFAQVLIDSRVTVANRPHQRRLGKQQQAITQNLRNLQQVFAQYPSLLGDEGASMQGIHFQDDQYVNGLGGAYYQNEETQDIIVGSRVYNLTNDDFFLRTVVHEIGHATFQQHLLNRAKVSEETLTGKYLTELATCQQQIAQLTQTTPNEASPSEELQDLQQQQTFLQQQITNETAPWSDDGQRFYAAWDILRQQKGIYLPSLALSDAADDLSNLSSPKGRQAYMARGFNEFCAELFMYMALDPALIAQHTIHLATMAPKQPSDPLAAIQKAWSQVVEILTTYRDLIAQGK